MSAPKMQEKRGEKGNGVGFARSGITPLAEPASKKGIVPSCWVNDINV